MDVAAEEPTPPIGSPVVDDVLPTLHDVLWAVTTDPETDAPLTVTRRYPTDASRLTASVLGTNLPAGSVVSADWSYNNTSLDAFATRIVVEETAPRRWLTFHLERKAGAVWPEGTYVIDVSLNGSPVRRGDVEVDDEQ
jgi:hypothetical protein